MAKKARVLSGMRPTGGLHLGHYHGVLKNWLQLQETYECYFCIVDWHALTTHYDETHTIAQHVFDMAVAWLAVGIDPKKSHLFIQSKMPEHAELHLLLSMVTPLPWLTRVPSYKDQQDKLTEKDLNTYGFLGYPLLQAADIFAYNADYVPVGEDQVPHIELAREVARRFNFIYGKDEDHVIITPPQTLLTQASKLPGLDGQKMSKSYHNTITLSDPPAMVEQKIKTMPTDPARVRRTDKGDPERCPVWSLHKVYNDEATLEWVQTGCRSAGIGCLECKAPLIRAVNAELSPIQEKMADMQAHPEKVYAALEQGAAAARLTAQQTLTEVKEVMGLAYPF
ncbi:MAG TPA: tryptophan--tRNA ligase [Gammaproteobacteria bacterium]|nr:tryptophan--tRNA ligase [Gammaproteobacteria bacterium]